MAPRNFRHLFSPQSKPSAASLGITGSETSILFKDSFRLPTLLLLGAVFQSLITTILPTRYAFTPMLVVLLHAVISTAIEIISSSAWRKGQGAEIINMKYSAQLPKESYNSNKPYHMSLGEDNEDNKSPFGSTPADRGVAVLHLGIRFNHPLGVLAPGTKEVGQVSAACNERLMAHINTPESGDDFGCLGITNWQGIERGSNNTILSVYYFRDMEGLNRFAHDPVHRKAWDWYKGEFMGRLGYSHIGVYHEAFWADRGQWETVYMNMSPTMMGRASVPVKNEGTGQTEWVSPIVDADHPRLRSQLGRMGSKVEGRKEGREEGY